MMDQPRHIKMEKQQTTVTSTSRNFCPCSYDLQKFKVKDVAMVMETDMDRVVGFFQKQGLKARKGFGRRREVLDPVLEVPLFHYPPLQHSLCLPDHTRSKVHLLTPPEQVVEQAPVLFRIDLYNGCGQPRSAGRDEVRAWLKSQDGNSSVAAKVTDLNNGSYIGETILPWSGVTFVRVSLTYPREFYRLVVELQHTHNSMRFTTQTMKNGNIVEVVPCLPSSPIPGYARTCDFTVSNGGRPWFCGYPVTRGLNCSHRSVFNNLPYLEPLPLPQPFKKYIHKLHTCCSGRPKNPDLRLIKNNIRLESFRVSPQPSGLKPACYSRPRRDSWSLPTPKGWLYHHQWVSSTCSLPPLTDQRVQRCTRNRTLILLGDSNQRLLWYKIRKVIGCSREVIRQWHAPHLCLNDQLRSTVFYGTHAFPFIPGLKGGFPVANSPLPVVLKNIEKFIYPGNEDVTVVIHYFMHLSTHPVQAYRRLVQEAHRTVQEYLQLHPRAKFLIRGPHVLYQGNDHHTNIGDTFAEWYQTIWKEEFSDLADMVWYIDTWDLTIASENLSVHPEPVVPDILKILFGYMCDV